MMYLMLYLLLLNTPQGITDAPCTTATVTDTTVTVNGVPVPYCRESEWEGEGE